jgi:hypothetical protein
MGAFWVSFLVSRGQLFWCRFHRKIGGRDVAQRRMWSVFTVVLFPYCNGISDVVKRGEQCLVQAFVLQPSIETRHEPDQHRLPGSKIVPFNACRLAPVGNRHQSVSMPLSYMIARSAAVRDNCIQFARTMGAGQ